MKKNIPWSNMGITDEQYRELFVKFGLSRDDIQRLIVQTKKHFENKDNMAQLPYPDEDDLNYDENKENFIMAVDFNVNQEWTVTYVDERGDYAESTIYVSDIVQALDEFRSRNKTKYILEIRVSPIEAFDKSII